MFAVFTMETCIRRCRGNGEDILEPKGAAGDLTERRRSNGRLCVRPPAPGGPTAGGGEPGVSHLGPPLPRFSRTLA